MSLKYALHLTASERQDLTRIAQGRGGRRRPPLWQVVRARALLKCDAGPQGAGWTDEAVAAATEGRTLASVADQGNSVYRRWAAWCDRGVWPRRMAYLQADPDRSAVRLDSTVGRAPKQKDGSHPRPQPGRLRHPDPHPGGSPRPSPTPARDGGQRHDRTQARVKPGRTRRGPA